eukprot:s181_g19.t2
METTRAARDARAKALLASLRRCDEELRSVLLHPPPPQATLLERREAALFGAGDPILWEKVKLTTSTATQGDFTVLIARPLHLAGKLPAALLMHATGKCKEFMANRLEQWARKGLIAVTFDAPWHGERALPEAGLSTSSGQSNSGSCDLSLKGLGPELLRSLQRHETARLDVYFKALIAGWRTASDRFVLDISRDALTVIDYLCARPDVLPERIGAAGVSLGGMACWLLAAADTRIRSAMPAIGVQSFNHSLRNGLWGARVDSIRPAFEAAAADLKKDSVDDDVVAAVWSRLAPGIAEVDPSNPLAFDAPLTLPCIAPRHLLVLNGEKDPRCPLEGVQKCIAAAKQAYEQEGKPEHFKIFIEKDVEHAMTDKMWEKIESFLEVSLGLPTTSKLYPELCGIPVQNVLCVEFLKRLQPYSWCCIADGELEARKRRSALLL